MKVLLTGATGFLGRHVVGSLLASSHSITVIARDVDRARSLPWLDGVRMISHDLHSTGFDWRKAPLPDVLVHLAWSGLPNYNDFFHIGKNLPGDLLFLESAVRIGVPRVVVAGTCLEYGMQSGPLTEETPTRPSTSYGFAKDTLRKSLELLQRDIPFSLQWVRLFYLYGEGQSPGSLLPQLDAALESGRDRFEMSGGDQLRDYLPVEAAARCFEWCVTHPEVTGVINCCSGVPISVLDFIAQHFSRRNRAIPLVRGYYPYPEYEPMAFWGVPDKLLKAGFSLSSQ